MGQRGAGERDRQNRLRLAQLREHAAAVAEIAELEGNEAAAIRQVEDWRRAGTVSERTARHLVALFGKGIHRTLLQRLAAAIGRRR